MNQKKYFDKHADTWDETCFHDKSKIETIMEILKLPDGASVVDAGTGTGILLPYIHSKIGPNGSITAVDISRKMIDRAEEKFNFENVDYLVADVLKLKHARGKYDYIICYSMFPHFKNQKKAVSKLAALLKEGGKLAIFHSQSRNEINGLHAKINGAVSRARLPEMPVIRKYLSEAGLSLDLEVDDENMFLAVGTKTSSGDQNIFNVGGK
ncbi:MAG: class I SAM-dependent methyltransferase [Eubacteriales bacterium]|nr:class I SAM-dependent methyltransferase [Eubacteriales bacterium]